MCIVCVCILKCMKLRLKGRERILFVGETKKNEIRERNIKKRKEKKKKEHSEMKRKIMRLIIELLKIGRAYLFKKCELMIGKICENKTSCRLRRRR